MSSLRREPPEAGWLAGAGLDGCAVALGGAAGGTSAAAGAVSAGADVWTAGAADGRALPVPASCRPSSRPGGDRTFCTAAPVGGLDRDRAGADEARSSAALDADGAGRSATNGLAVACSAGDSTRSSVPTARPLRGAVRAAEGAVGAKPGCAGAATAGACGRNRLSAAAPSGAAGFRAAPGRCVAARGSGGTPAR
jgi:hypothetical protein